MWRKREVVEVSEGGEEEWSCGEEGSCGEEVNVEEVKRGVVERMCRGGEEWS